MVTWPGKIASGVKTPQIMASIDLMPTFVKLANVTDCEFDQVHGYDQSQFWLGNKRVLSTCTIFSNLIHIKLRPNFVRCFVASNLFLKVLY